MGTVTNPNAIHALQIRAQISAVKLEKLGMRRSGGNLTPRLKKFYGLPRTAKHEELLGIMKEHLRRLDEKLLKEADQENMNS